MVEEEEVEGEPDVEGPVAEQSEEPFAEEGVHKEADAEVSREGAGFVEDEGERVDEEFGVVGRKERFERCDEAVHGERLREEALVFDNNVENFPRTTNALL